VVDRSRTVSQLGEVGPRGACPSVQDVVDDRLTRDEVIDRLTDASVVERLDVYRVLDVLVPAGLDAVDEEVVGSVEVVERRRREPERHVDLVVLERAGAGRVVGNDLQFEVLDHRGVREVRRAFEPVERLLDTLLFDPVVVELLDLVVLFVLELAELVGALPMGMFPCAGRGSPSRSRRSGSR